MNVFTALCLAALALGALAKPAKKGKRQDWSWLDLLESTTSNYPDFSTTTGSYTDNDWYTTDYYTDYYTGYDTTGGYVSANDRCGSKTYSVQAGGEVRVNSRRDCDATPSGGYPNNADWTFTITNSGSGNYANIRYWNDIEGGNGCPYDYLMFNDMHRICDNNRRGQVSLNVGSTLTVRFVSDSSVIKRGFRFNVTFSDAPQYNGELSTPGYPHYMTTTTPYWETSSQGPQLVDDIHYQLFDVHQLMEMADYEGVMTYQMASLKAHIASYLSDVLPWFTTMRPHYDTTTYPHSYPTHDHTHDYFTTTTTQETTVYDTTTPFPTTTPAVTAA